MVADLEGAIRPLLDSLGLQWDEGLLAHQSTARERGSVNTASYAQVTGPFHDRAAGRWRRYEARMEELFPIAGPWAECLGHET